MRKNIITKIMAVVLAVATVISPVTADAAEKKTVTRDDYAQQVEEYDVAWDNGKIGEAEYCALEYKYVKTLNGCYNEDGVKIVTVLNGKTKKITKTGKYDVIVGGKTAKKDQGTIKFVAPKTGTYKFKFSVKNNVTGNNVCIELGKPLSGLKTKYYQNIGGEKVYNSTSWSTLVLLAVEGTSYRPATGLYLDRQPGSCSEMKTLTGTIKLKKGQSITLVCRNPEASLDETYAYRFTDFVVTIRKVK